ncbi:hypothetical protein ABVG11_37705 [Streptomyces sp. HD1123-B1]|uniref:hypothetical protein n=1 Tax=Streptomyces huangiella TaxID=3228804 RepID=UPI003D7CFACF
MAAPTTASQPGPNGARRARTDQADVESASLWRRGGLERLVQLRERRRAGHLISRLT